MSPETRTAQRFTTRSMAALTLCAALGVGGCTLDPAAIPVPGATVSGPTYRVHIEFANALNLPAKAKVTANGNRVGNLDTIRVIDPTAIRPGLVVAEVDISSSVRLPATTVAQLRQETLLGDVYIALTTPPNGYDRTIPAAGTITIDHTRPPLQVEDLLSGLATFVGGGAVTQFQDIVNRVNATLPADPAETARLSGLLSRDVTDLSAHLDTVSALGNAVRSDLQAIQDVRGDLAEILSPDGAAQVAAATGSIVQLLGVIGAIGTIAHGIDWLAPVAASGNAAAKALVPLLFTARPLDVNAPSNLNRLVTLLRETIIPFVENGPKVNIVGVHSADTAQPVSADDQTARIVATLRMIGAVR